MKYTLRALVTACMLTMASAFTSAAQSANKSSVPDSVKQKIVGRWEGQYYSDHAPENAMAIAIARDTTWKAVMTISAGQDMPPSALKDFNVDGHIVSWAQELMGMPCKANASLVAGALKGEINCGHASIGFLLRKK